jgi:hypothetical protein
MGTKGAAVIHANGAFIIAVAAGVALILLRIAHGTHAEGIIHPRLRRR